MRRSLSFVLVLMLVLRGLLGDAMAMGTVPVAAPAVQSASAAALHHHAPAAVEALLQAHEHEGHGGHQAQVHDQHASGCAAQAGGVSTCGEHEHGPSCSACGICHSALFTPGLPDTAGLVPTPSLNPQGSVRFASATTLQVIKPPIS